MIGISEALEKDLTLRYSAAEIAQFFSGRANRGQILLVYQRPNGDRTSGLPSSRHMFYLSRGWLAVGIADAPAAHAEATAPTAAAKKASGTGVRGR